MKNPTRHYFLSDAHFGSGFGNDDTRAEIFAQFCDTICGTNCTVTIVGDFFDFWIEYSHVMRTDYLKVAASIYNLRRSGIPVTFIAGNHDFMPYTFFEEQLGISIVRGHSISNFNGHAIYLCHGDDLRGDWKYRALHAFLRNKTAQRLYCAIHPTIGIGLAEYLSKLSRKHSTKTGRYLSDERQKWYHAKADELLKNSNAHVLIMGHTHRADITILENGIHANCGAWLNAPTVIILDNDIISLVKFSPESTSKFEEIQSCNIPA